MLVHVLSSFFKGPNVEESGAAKWLIESAAEDPFHEHRLTKNPEEADLILFAAAHPGTDPFLLKVARHPVYRRFPEKSFIYHDADRALPILRGIFPGIRRQDYQPDRCRSAGYIARIAENKFVRYDPAPVRREWLYSFFGDANCPVRRAIFASQHPQGLVRDTTGRRHWELPEGPARQDFLREFAEAIQKSQFVLCPCGTAPSSYRLFETMEMGRVPVILADEWVPVNGPRWDEFSIRLPENRLDNLQQILTETSPRHEEMGRLARAAWEQYFSKPVSFHRLTELCAEVKAERTNALSALRPRLKLWVSPNRRIWLRPKYHRLKARFGASRAAE